MTVEKKIEFLSSTFNQIQNLINLADSKANTSLTLQTFFVGYVLGSSIISGVFEKLKISQVTFIVNMFYIIFVLFIISSVIGIIICLLVYKARFPVEKNESKRAGLLYFNHINKFKNSDSYLEKIQDLNEDHWLEELTRQVYNISHIVSDKMKYVNGTILFLFINLSLSITLTILAIYLLLW